MPDNIDKTRIERIGDRSFSCSGVDTIPDVMEENIDLRQQIQDMINEALANVTGAVVIQDVPDQITYQFGGGGITQAQLDAAISMVLGEMNDLFSIIMEQMWRQFRRIGSRFISVENQINNLESGSETDITSLAEMSAAQLDLESGVPTLIQFDSPVYDPDSMHDDSNYTITVPKDGTYLVCAAVLFQNCIVNKVYQLRVQKNGGNIVYFSRILPDSAPSTTIDVRIIKVLRLSEGDVLRVYAVHGAGVDTVDLASSTTNQFFSVSSF